MQRHKSPPVRGEGGGGFHFIVGLPEHHREQLASVFIFDVYKMCLVGDDICTSCARGKDSSHSTLLKELQMSNAASFS